MNNTLLTLLHVLIVEDSEDDTLLLMRELRRGGYEVRYRRVQTEKDFTEALASQAWHLIIADYHIPGFGGMAALRTLHLYEKDIPFIMMSGVIDEDNAMAVETLRAGAQDFIVKGRTARLIPAIERELGEAEQRAIRREMETKFRRSEDRLRIALEAARLSVWEWDIANDLMTYGDYFEELFGEAIQENDTHYQSFLARLHPEDQAYVAHAIQHTLDNGLIYDLQFRVIWQDGSIHWLHSQGCVYTDENGSPVSITGVLQNITERKKAEETLLEKERLKVALDKERELAILRNRFMMTAAHEFRTPLTVISTANEMLYEMYDDLTPQQHKEYLGEISSRVRYLRDMLTQIESVTRDEHLPLEFTPQLTDLKSLSKRLIGDVLRVTGNTHHIDLVTECDPCEYLLDSRLVTHILNNLLSNAIKYSKKGSEIGLHIAEEDGWLTLRVIDQGIGIPPDDLQNIYELFFRGSNIGAVGGRGIGLKIVKDSVDTHRGQMDVESEVGKGTMFTIRLPLTY
jgi:PAS domain S-box-containing protein